MKIHPDIQAKLALDTAETRAEFFRVMGSLRSDNDLVPLLLKMLRQALALPSHLSKKELEQAKQQERQLADYCFYNDGWHAARSSGPDNKLVGLYSTELLLPFLRTLTEYVQSHVNEKKIGKLPGGRNKGSYEPFHYDPGHLMVAALIDTQPQKSATQHLQKALKDKLLKEDLSIGTYKMRMKRIKERQEKEEAARLALLGKNIVRLVPKKPRTKH